MLDNIAGNAFLEVDKLVGLGYEKQNGRLSLPRGDVLHPRDRGGYETCISAGSGNGDSRDGNDWPRRPGTNEEYWSTPLNLWLKMSHTRQVVLCHVGQINETPEGEQAQAKIANNVQRTVRNVWSTLPKTHGKGHNPLGFACSRCRFYNLACSHEPTGKNIAKKSKIRNARGKNLGSIRTRR